MAEILFKRLGITAVTNALIERVEPGVVHLRRWADDEQL
jgi:hypothetical protein